MHYFKEKEKFMQKMLTLDFLCLLFDISLILVIFITLQDHFAHIVIFKTKHVIGWSLILLLHFVVIFEELVGYGICKHE